MRRHGVDFSDAVVALEDENALTVEDPGHEERRFKTLGSSTSTDFDMSEDFSKGKRGPVVRPDPGKVRITIRLDADILEHFKKRVHEAGGGNYQTLINEALREYIKAHDKGLEDALRKVIREELKRTG